MDAPMEFLHVIDRHPEIGSGKDYSGAIGIDAQEDLLTQLSAEDEIRTRTVREQGRVFLNRLRERALATGAQSVDVRQRHGELEETLVEQESGVRLLVLGRRGEAAEATQRNIGRNVERVVRSLRKPVLAVTENFREPKRVMFAFDAGIVARRGIGMVAASPLFQPNSRFTDDFVLTIAVAQAILTDGDYRRSVRDCQRVSHNHREGISLGGDSDTLACITGAIA
jgi:nucleotide-binding universal stress UspA family protein